MTTAESILFHTVLIQPELPPRDSFPAYGDFKIWAFSVVSDFGGFMALGFGFRV